MALILGASKGNVLEWRGTSELFADLKKRLVAKRGFLLQDDGVELLKEFRGSLSEEIEYEEQFSRRLAQIFEELEQAEFDQLKGHYPQVKELATEYFQRRSSAAAVAGICNAATDAIVCHALGLAEKGMLLDDLGAPPAPYCWLVSGASGRMELTLDEAPPHFLVYEDADPDASSYFDQLRYRITAIFKKTGLISGTERDFMRQGLWHGSLTEWQALFDARLRHRKNLHDHSGLPSLGLPFRPLGQEDEELFEAVASLSDMRPVRGDQTLFPEIFGVRSRLLDRFCDTDSFRHLGRQISVLPVALNLFGWLRVERTGEHRGELNLDDHAIRPLLMNICLLSLRHKVRETNTIERVRALVQTGRLDVELGERVIRAYHEVMRRKLHLQASGKTGVSYLNPEDLSEEETDSFKEALETILNLQKLAHHEFTEYL